MEKTLQQQTLQDRIRERAYYLSMHRPGEGDTHHFWLAAEREVLAEIAAETLDASTPETAPVAETTEPVLPVTVAETVKPIQAAQPKKAAGGKLRAAAKAPAKASAKAAPPAAPAKAATITPIRPASKAPAKPAISASKARARAGGR
jgi:hypothetical protein